MKKTIHILFLFFMSCLAAAQSSSQQEIHFNHLFVKDGMPEGRVNTIVQDNQGYMWIGTQKGLVRYDGYSTKVYDFGLENPYDQDVLTLYVDRQNRLWAGGLIGGLYLYERGDDRFIKYNTASSTRDSSSLFIIKMHEDQKGNLWLICYDNSRQQNYLKRIDPVNRTSVSYNQLEKGNHYIKAADFVQFGEDEQGAIWVDSKNGIYHYDEKADHFDSFLVEDDSAKQQSCYSMVSSQGFLWMGAHKSRPPFNPEGLWRFDPKTKAVTSFTHNAGDGGSLANDNVHWVFRDAKDRLWITTDGGLSFYDPEKNIFINYLLADPGTRKPIPFDELKEDSNGNLWLSTQRAKGLVFFNTQTRTFTLYPAHEKEQYGLADNIIHNFYIDHAGTLWFGAAQIGLQWINTQLSRFTEYKDQPGQPHHFPGGVVTSFAEGNDSTIWLGTRHGIYHWHPHTDSFNLVNVKIGQEKDFTVGGLRIDQQGLVWFGVPFGSSPGLYSYDEKTGKTKYYSYHKEDTNSLSNNQVARLLVDHLGNLWVGTFGGGICRFNSQTQNFTRYPYVDGRTGKKHAGFLDDRAVLTIYEDKNGTIWVGTNLGGLNRLDQKTGTFTSYYDQLPGFQCINSIAQDHTNLLWVGTYFGGVFSFDPNTNLAKKYTEKHGLLYDGALGILEDKHDNLWIAAERGISIFNLESKRVRKLTRANGLPSENLTNAFKASSGLFLFSSNDGGFISVNPNEFRPNPNPPITHIESVDFSKANEGKTKDSTFFTFGKDSISLKYNENRLTFHYVGIYFQNPQLNQYAYKLDGYDKDWVAGGTQRAVTYTNLSFGTYTFHVKSANSDGVWNSKGDSFSFTILPPWWQTWWAYLLYVLILAIAVWAFAAYRSRNLRQANQLLEEKVAQRTSELNQSIHDLKATQTQLIQAEKMASLGELTAGIAHEIQNPLNFVNNFSEVNTELSEELEQEADKGNIDEIKIIAKDIKENSEKISHHGKRADAIVKGMLQHSRSSSGQKELTNINELADEYFRLAYHGLRAKDSTFNARLKTDFDPDIGEINIIPQDFGRVLLNLYNNAFYAVEQKSGEAKQDFDPTVSVSTKKNGDKIAISVTDNGNGIPQKVVDKIFQPFFTTKPTGQGTGLGLSLSYDIVKAHGGEIKVETKEKQWTTFTIQLPI